jgi:hypothetical protein
MADHQVLWTLAKVCGGWILLSLVLSLAMSRILGWLDDREARESEH